MSATAFRVWCPDRGETESDGFDIDRLCFDVTDAAQYWAECHSGFHGDPWDELEVMVRDGDQEPVEVSLTVEAVPHFSARRKR